MKVQQDFVNALQREEDPRYRFRVDRWTRKEGGGGVTCILQVRSDGLKWQITRSFQYCGMQLATGSFLIVTKDLTNTTDKLCMTSTP